MRLHNPVAREPKDMEYESGVEYESNVDYESGVEYESGIESRRGAKVGHICFVVTLASARSIQIHFHDRFSGTWNWSLN